jgi:acetylornithine/succinyldiaminopimelate/putrescine aminotransferase
MNMRSAGVSCGSPEAGLMAAACVEVGHELGVPAAELVGRLAAEGVLCLDEAPWSIRFVTHLDVDDDDIEAAVTAARRALSAAGI